MTGGAPTAPKSYLRSARGAGLRLRPSQDHQGAISDSGADRGCDAGDAANAVLAGEGRIRDLPNFSGPTAIPKLLQAEVDRKLRELRYRPRAVAHSGYRSGGLPASDRRQAFPYRDGFEAEAEIGLSARIVDKDGKVIASRLFDESEKFAKVEPQAAVTAFDTAFGRIAKDMIAWTVRALQ